jgi:hypothetical protein
MTPTDVLLQATARLDTAALTERDPADAIAFGVLVLDAPPEPDGRDRARRHLACGEFLRAWSRFEPPDRAQALLERAAGQDLLAALALVAR